MPERPSHQADEARFPHELPPVLAEALKLDRRTSYFISTNLGTACVVKLPEEDLVLFTPRVPMRVSHELYPLQQAPVLRTELKLYLAPDVLVYENTPALVTLEMFTDVGDEQQAEEFDTLTRQSSLPAYFYDEQLTLRQAKRFGYTQGPQAAWLLQQARYLHAAIAPTEHDFDAAKATVMQRRRL